ncbi:hypothetical protein Q4E93_12915 [Flavitalea sp. BT771]|uniref:hypothetical protein n=1 Tax=Flavitalea sp. BT771 TaxID=3063329 RepID=UPI0026E1CEE2|nr:hypothetical protein [Flavitalea sp. BT771]MDO6431498.1 hypothetical protein [Flavitalea sp. BT771]MDV6220406.1 hypothetical protein [Flavitalea sp. BT771]
MNSRIYRPLCMLCLVLAQFVYSPQSNAQSLTRTPLVTTTAWQKQEDYMESRLPGKLVTEMKKTVGSLASWAQRSGVDSLGCTPAWCGAYFSNKTNAFPLFKYEMRSAFFTGEVGFLNAGAGKGSSLVITANDLAILQQTFSLNGNDYLSLPAMQQTHDGVQYAEWMTEKDETAEARRARSWVISYAGRMPYSILSRKQYLEEAKKEIAADKQKLKEDLLQRIPVKTAQQEEVEQKREIESIGAMYSGATRDSRVRSYLASYKPDSVYFKEVFADQSASLDADSLLLDHLLTKSSADYLEKPAFVSVPAHDFRDFEDGKPGCRMLAKWNMPYFDKNLSLARPQFLVVSWQFDPAVPTAVNLDKVISGLDYCALQDLLIAAGTGSLK